MPLHGLLPSGPGGVLQSVLNCLLFALLCTSAVEAATTAKSAKIILEFVQPLGTIDMLW